MGTFKQKQHNFGDCCSHVLAAESVTVFTCPDLDKFDTEVSWRLCMERDFQDGATGMNKIAFCNFCDEKRPEREAELKGFTPSPLPPPPPVLPSCFFIFQSPKMFYFWLIVIVIVIIIIEYYATCLKAPGSLQLIVTILRQKCSQTMIKKI